MPLSINKSTVFHCGSNNHRLKYSIDNKLMSTSIPFKDLGVIRSEQKLYIDHISHLSAKCHRLSGEIRRAFGSRDVELMWTAFQVYVTPIIMYASTAWSPLLKCVITMLESMQRRFT